VVKLPSLAVRMSPKTSGPGNTFTVMRPSGTVTPCTTSSALAARPSLAGLVISSLGSVAKVVNW
jgi:hypothetical protein